MSDRRFLFLRTRTTIKTTCGTGDDAQTSLLRRCIGLHALNITDRQAWPYFLGFFPLGLCFAGVLFAVALLQRGLPSSPAPLFFPDCLFLLSSSPTFLSFSFSSFHLSNFSDSCDLSNHGPYRPASVPVPGRETAQGGPRTVPVLEALGALRGRETVGYRLVLFPLCSWFWSGEGSWVLPGEF